MNNPRTPQTAAPHAASVAPSPHTHANHLPITTDHDHDHDAPISIGIPASRRIANLIGILVPFAGFVAAMVYSWGWGLGWAELIVLFTMYLLTGLGVTVGFHRLFAHKSFSTGPIVTAILAILGSMSVQGPLIRWVAFHRSHHQHSDHEHDPHSPHGYGTGPVALIKGFWNAHIGWMLKRSNDQLARYIPDLRRSKLINTISVLFPLWVLLSLTIPAALGGLLTLSWSGAFLGMLWGGLVRIALLHHITWSVNSICHLWGTRPFQSRDHSRNNPIVGVLAFGEGWHNNHHAFPTSARHGLRWYQVDLSYFVIWAMERLGLVWRVRLPAPDSIAHKRRRRTA